MGTDRKKFAHASVEEAVGKLQSGEHPLGVLHPPPNCSACKGGNKGHHFLCGRRPQDPPQKEMAIRRRIRLRLNQSWSALQGSSAGTSSPAVATIRSTPAAAPAAAPNRDAASINKPLASPTLLSFFPTPVASSMPPPASSATPATQAILSDVAAPMAAPASAAVAAASATAATAAAAPPASTLTAEQRARIEANRADAVARREAAVLLGAPPPKRAASASAASVAAPVVLAQARSRGSALSTVDAAKASKAKMERNKWKCTCLPDPDTRGPKYHAAACPRMTFERNSVDPVIGEIVFGMGCAGPRAGHAWRCDRVHRKGWTRVPQLDKV